MTRKIDRLMTAAALLIISQPADANTPPPVYPAPDTIALIDKDQLRQNVVAWAMDLEELAHYEGELKPEPKS